jgi:nucleoside-diphosphate-sugar epimerase
MQLPVSASMGEVLVLGGTGFRGHLTTEQLVKDGHNVTVISRGFRYWDIFQRLAPHITHWRPTGSSPGPHLDQWQGWCTFCQIL